MASLAFMSHQGLFAIEPIQAMFVSVWRNVQTGRPVKFTMLNTS